MTSPCTTPAQCVEAPSSNNLPNCNVEDSELSYHYQPILANDQMRVLRLEPGAFDKPLIGSLVVRKIGDDEENPPAYDCVSYCWGVQQHFTSFDCDGKALRITATVDEMLRHFREPTMPHDLWIDAICINQTDTQEKSQQVRIMNRIYAFARKVRIWLGPATDEELDALFPLFRGSTLSFQESYCILQERYRTSSCECSKSVASSWHEFLSRGWFTRRWVIQEVFLDRIVIFHRGKREIPWTAFVDSITAFCSAYASLLTASQYIATREVDSKLNTLNTMRLRKTGCQEELSINAVYGRVLQLLQTYHTTICVDERDRLYSLYGLLPYTEETEGLTEVDKSCPVDYTVHFSNLYNNFASAACKSGQSHRIIEHAIGFGGLSQQDSGWPSWVPSWNLTCKIRAVDKYLSWVRTPLPLSEILAYYNFYVSAEGRLWKEDNPDVTYVYGLGALHLRGCIQYIRHSQTSTSHLDALSYFKTVLRSQDSAESRFLMAWVMTLAINEVPFMYSRQGIDSVDLVVSRQPPSKFCSEKIGNVWLILNIIFGLPFPSLLEERAYVDEIDFSIEARRILQGLDAFCYEVEGSHSFGIAFARVEPGDFVFRTTRALRAEQCDGEGYVPSVFALIIRPYQPHGFTGPVCFRLVGMCLDYYPDVKDPEIVDVILV